MLHFILESKQLLSQRYQIGSLCHLKPAEIARRIGKHRSVVTRELARNGPTRQAYQPQTAHQRAAQRKKANALKTTPALVATITEGLAQQWSPDQITGRCQQQGQPMLSRAAIYAIIWRDQRQGGQLYKDLRHANRPDRKRYGNRANAPNFAVFESFLAWPTCFQRHFQWLSVTGAKKEGLFSSSGLINPANRAKNREFGALALLIVRNLG